MYIPRLVNGELQLVEAEDEEDEETDDDGEAQNEQAEVEADTVEDDRACAQPQCADEHLRPAELVTAEVDLPSPPVAHRRPLPAPPTEPPVATRATGVASVPVMYPDVAIAVETRLPRRETFSISGRFGAGWSGIGAPGLWDLGVGMSYTLDPRVAIDFRSDFQLSMDDEGTATGLSSMWFSLNMLVYFNNSMPIQPYLLAGLVMAVVPGNRDLGQESDVAAGGQAGIGIEVLIQGVVGISVEAVGFIAGHESSIVGGGVMLTSALTWYI